MIKARTALTLPTCTAHREGRSIIIKANGEISNADWSTIFDHFDFHAEDFDFDFAIEGDTDIYTISEVQQ